VTASVALLRPVGGSGWRAEWPAVVAAAVRTEFRADVLYSNPGDPVLFGPACVVAGCPSPGRGRHLLCVAHGAQFRKRGQGLPVGAWLVLTGERDGPCLPRGLRELGGCQAAGCGRSAWTRLLCHSHQLRWRRTAGQPPLELYCATTSPDFEGSAGQRPESCAAESCRFPRMTRTPLCDGHQRRFADRRRRKGYTVERYLRELAHPGRPAYVLEGLPEPLRAELQFGLQCFSDRRMARLRPNALADAASRLRERGYRSLGKHAGWPICREASAPETDQGAGQKPTRWALRQLRHHLPPEHRRRLPWHPTGSRARNPHTDAGVQRPLGMAPTRPIAKCSQGTS
jgi:hypothetical protein